MVLTTQRKAGLQTSEVSVKLTLDTNIVICTFSYG